MLHPVYFDPGSRIRLPEAAVHIGQPSDAFEVVDCFAGGMGVCLHLRHSETGQDFGLKSPRPEFVADKGASARFIEELRVWLAASACTGVAEALAVFRLNDMPVVMSRWLEGGDWSKSMQTMPAALCFVNLLRVIRTLDWVFENIGVAHRDLKPANILLDRDRLAYVADWGLAKPVEDQLREVAPPSSPRYQRLSPASATQYGTFVGTVLYAAPEQILGTGSIDHRADIYSLGCIMFELETGALPFFGKDAIEIASKHLYEAVPKIDRAIRSKTFGIEEIVFRCLQKDPAARYQTHSQLAQALEDAARGQTIDIQRATISTRCKRNVIGTGDPAALPENALLSNDGRFAVVEQDDVRPLFDEAASLMGLGRYRDAAKILQRFYVPQLAGDEWHAMHGTGCDLAYCWSQIEDDQKEAICIFEQLSSARAKPANFYINYALALLRAGRAADALDACRRGMRYYPEDIDLLGNLAIALLHVGEKSQAADACLKRLSIRRDIHSLEESAVTLRSIAEELRWVDPETSVRYARLAVELATEGIALNPGYPSLFLARGNAYRLFNRSDLAAADYKLTIETPWHRSLREIALAQFLKMLEAEKSYETALSVIEKWGSLVTSAEIRQDIEAVKMRIAFEDFMFGKVHNGYRAVVPEVVKFFRSARRADGFAKYPVELAKVEDWIGRRAEAFEILKSTLTDAPGNLEAMETLVRGAIEAVDYETAAVWSKRLIEAAPFKAEGYDLASVIARRTGDNQAAEQFKAKADRVFAAETVLLTL